MLYRELSEEIKEWAEFFPVIAIVGPRQVGKTTLAKAMGEHLGKNAEYLDLENPRHLTRLSDPVLFFEAHQDHCVIIDEIQFRPDLFPIMRAMVDQHRVPCRFIILGSASPSLMRDSSESLAGRVTYTELTPFHLNEVGTGLMEKHWFRGGFPDAFLAKKVTQTHRWHHSFIQTYIERDLPLLGLDVDPVLMRRLWSMIAHVHGNLANMSNLGRALELTHNTIRKYLDFLEGAFLIRQLRPYSTNHGKRLVKAPKLYFRDSGVLHHLMDVEDYAALVGHPMVGNSWEGYVIEQIVTRLPQGCQAYFYRTHQGAECDLVIVRDEKPIQAIEIKFTVSPKLKRGNTQAFMDIGAEQNLVIIPDEAEYPLNESVKVCGLGGYLKRELPA